MKITRLITLLTVLILLFPTQAALAGVNKPARGRVPTDPIVTVTPFTTTTARNSTVTYNVTVSNIPNGGIHCAKVDLFVPSGFKLYPGAGYSFYHVYNTTPLEFKVKVPNTAQRRFLYGRVSWSRDYACKSIRTTNFSSQVEIIVTK